MCMKVVSVDDFGKLCDKLPSFFFNSHGKSRYLPSHTFFCPTQCPWNAQVLEVFRATTTDWKGPMSSIAMWRPSAFGIFTWRSGPPGLFLGGLGWKVGWKVKGGDFKRLVSLMYIWYMIYVYYFFCWKTIDLCVKYSQMGDIAWSLREHNKR